MSDKNLVEQIQDCLYNNRLVALLVVVFSFGLFLFSFMNSCSDFKKNYLPDPELNSTKSTEVQIPDKVDTAQAPMPKTNTGKKEADSYKSNKESSNPPREDHRINNGIQIDKIIGDVTINQYQKKPDLIIEDEIAPLLNRINPEIIKLYKSGQLDVAVMISRDHVSELKKMKIQLAEKKILEFIPTYSVIEGGSGNSFGGHLNDLEEGSMEGYRLVFLKNFKFIKF